MCDFKEIGTFSVRVCMFSWMFFKKLNKNKVVEKVFVYKNFYKR